MSDIVTDIINYLVTLGYAKARGRDIFPFFFPGKPVNCLVVIDLNGMGPDYASSSTISAPNAIDYPGVQVQCRNTDLKTAYDTMEAIRKDLDLNPPAGYVTLRTTRAQPSNVTSPDELGAVDGPMYRFSVDFISSRVR
jgi:hypothetical protein